MQSITSYAGHHGNSLGGRHFLHGFNDIRGSIGEHGGSHILRLSAYKHTNIITFMCLCVCMLSMYVYSILIHTQYS